jgi:hypothetical protein
MLRQRAERHAANEVADIQHTMRLENQAISAEDLEDQRRKIVDHILAGNLKGVWDR